MQDKSQQIVRDRREKRIEECLNMVIVYGKFASWF